MLWNYILFIAPLIIVTVIAMWLAHKLLAYRPQAGATSLALFMVSLAFWSVAYGLELGNAAPAIKIFWYKAKYLGVVAVLISAAYFVFQYVGYYRWANWRGLFAIGSVPAVALAALWTNSFHHLFLRNIAVGAQSPISMLHVEYGLLFWIFTAYYYAIFALSMTLLVRRCWTKCSGQLCRNVLALLVGASAPWLANIFTLSPWNPMPDLDLTPFMFMVTGTAIAWALFRHQLLYMMPVQHGAIIRSMKDGVIVLNAQNQIVEMNPAAQRILHMQMTASDDFVGQPIDQVLAIWPTLLTYLRGLAKEYNTVLTSDDSAGRRYFDVHITPIYSQRDQLAGRLLVIHESTERERTAEALRQRKQQLRSMVEQMRYADHEKTQIMTMLQTELDMPLLHMRESLMQLENGASQLEKEYVIRIKQEVEALDNLVRNLRESMAKTAREKSAASSVHTNGHGSSSPAFLEAEAKLSTAQLTSISGAHRFSPAS
ncbi:MAG: PAS domain-containing protein [Caldilineaceae bacterium]|nr:PAS domain-containing protein [Caldilineaceae bacterium]